MDIDYGSIYLYENPVFMSVWVMVIPLGITMIQTDIKTSDITMTQTDITDKKFYGEIRSHSSPF